MLARVIYGFRISVLFGLTLTLLSSVVGIAAGAVQGYFGGWVDLLFQRFIEIWGGLPTLYLLIILASIVEPSFWWLLDPDAAVQLDGAGRRGARRVPARPQPRLRPRRPGARRAATRTIMFRHILPNAMVATLTFMPFILNGSITTLTSLDFLGFGLPPGSPSLGELLARARTTSRRPGSASPASSVAGGDAVAAGLHRRGGARRLRPAQDLPLMAMACSRSSDLASRFGARRRASRPCRGVSFALDRGETLAWSARAARASR